MMSKFLCGGLALGLGFVAMAAADEPNNDSVVGAKVKLTGCLISDKENSFILNRVDELYGPKSSTSTPTPMAMSGMKGGGPNEVIYWLSSDSVKKMRGHLGHRVEVTGEISDVSMGTIRIAQDPGRPGPDNDNKIAIEARGKESELSTDRPIGLGRPHLDKIEETQRLPVRRVKVDTIQVLPTTCQ